MYCFSSAQSQPVRTLEEREAAYAAARLRILGSTAESSTHTAMENTRHSKSVMRFLCRHFDLSVLTVERVSTLNY